MLVPALVRTDFGGADHNTGHVLRVASSGPTPGQAAARAPCADVPHFRFYG